MLVCCLYFWGPKWINGAFAKQLQLKEYVHIAFNDEYIKEITDKIFFRSTSHNKENSFLETLFRCLQRSDIAVIRLLEEEEPTHSTIKSQLTY